ncbi:MAG: hypothetical protein KGL21_10080, partial [Alphaproteobacteria bacterium]|nr:hypothetical protein [Alphaproteobacteria bacterium]
MADNRSREARILRALSIKKRRADSELARARNTLVALEAYADRIRVLKNTLHPTCGMTQAQTLTASYAMQARLLNAKLKIHASIIRATNDVKEKSQNTQTSEKRIEIYINNILD